MRIQPPLDVNITEEESICRGKFFTLLTWVQLQGYRMPSLEWRITQSVFDDCFMRFWDNYFLIGFAFASPWRSRNRGWLKQFTWPTMVGLWFGELGRRSCTDPNCGALYWNSVIFLDSPLGMASRRIELAWGKMEEVEKQSEALGNGPPTFQSFDSIAKSLSGTADPPPDWVATRLPYERQRLVAQQSFAAWLISSFFLRRTIQDVFGGSSFMHKVPLQPRPGANSSSSSSSSATSSLHSKDEKNKKSSGDSSNKDEEFELELINIQITNRFLRWRPLRISQQPRPDGSEFFLDIALPVVAATPFAVLTLAHGDLLSINAQNLGKYWWRLHLFALRALGVPTGPSLDFMLRHPPPPPDL